MVHLCAEHVREKNGIDFSEGPKGLEKHETNEKCKKLPKNRDGDKINYSR